MPMRIEQGGEKMKIAVRLTILLLTAALAAAFFGCTGPEPGGVEGSAEPTELEYTISTSDATEAETTGADEIVLPRI